MTPFAGVTLSDSNSGATDTLTVTITGGGTLSGTGLVGVGSSYTLSGTASAITSALDALTFVPTAGQPNTSNTAIFTLSDQSTAYATPTVSSGYSVTDIDPAVAPTVVRGGTAVLTTLASFDGANGRLPDDGIVADSAGDLFGATGGGGSAGSGTLFELVHGASSITTLVSLSGATAGTPYGGLTIDAAGDLFGALGANTGSAGAVFELAPGASVITILATLTTSSGENPEGRLAVDAAGDVFGTGENAGGVGTNDGAVFEVAAGTDALTRVAAFTGSSGAIPYGGLVIDQAGNLFGTTISGGTASGGVIFEIAKGSTSITVLASLSSATGTRPYAGLTIDSAGDLFGTTISGGGAGHGTVFELAHGASSVTVLASFATANPTDAPLILDAAGDLFGVNGAGVFELAAGASSITTLATPAGATAGLATDAAGDLFGTTSVGGSAGDGTVYEVSFVTALTTVAEAPVAPFAGVELSDTNAGATDTLTISLGGAGGTLSGAGLSGGGSTYTLSGTAAAVASALDALTFTPTAGQTYSSNTTSFTLSEQSTAYATPTVASGFSVTDIDPGPSTITGGGVTSTTAEAPVAPFAGVTVGDRNGGATDTLTITVSGAGGTLSGAGLSGSGSTYMLSGTAAAVTSALDALTFTPVAGQPNTSSTTTFTLSDQTTAYAGAATASGFAVTDIDPAVAPVFAGGTAVTQTASEVPVKPFAGVTLSDANIGATDTLTITLSGGGTLSGAGLTGSGGAYTLSGTPAAVTSALDALTFHPASGRPNTSNTTTFTLSDKSTAFASATPASVSVIDTDAAVAATFVRGGTADLTTLVNFDASYGNPSDSLITDAAGDLFGTASNEIVELPLAAAPVRTLAAVSYTSAGLVADAAGDLFGVTVDNGGPGEIFELAKGASQINALASVSGYASTLTIDAAGDLFGTTQSGGSAGGGTVFELPAGASTITTLASFPAYTSPNGGLVVDAAGDLFGTTQYGGSDYDGTVFELAAGASTVTTLWSFDGNADGGNPAGGLLIDAAGDLFGTTQAGGSDYNGTVFELAAGASTVTTLASFGQTPNESSPNPVGSLVADAAGDLFGVEQQGNNYEGAVFELAAGASTVTTLVNFVGPNGDSPQAGLVADAAGDLFGTTYAGGTGNGTVFQEGTVFRVSFVTSLTTTEEAPVTPFAGVTLGDANSGATDVLTISLGGAGGTLSAAGLSGGGETYTLSGTAASVTSALDAATFTPASGLPGASHTTTFTLSDQSSAYASATTISGFSVTDLPAAAPTIAGALALTTLYAFQGNGDGYEPMAGLLADAAGDLFGTTEYTVFELAAGATSPTTLASFSGYDGLNALTEDARGNLFGTSPFNVTSYAGTVFELAAGAASVTTLATFDGTNGFRPTGALIADAAGDLFGTTAGGGSDGTVFELAAGTGSITTLVTFSGGNGADPAGGLVADSAGDLFGTTFSGGSADDGTVFEVAAGTHSATTLATFTGANGANPAAGLILDAAGDLFGTTEDGGSAGQGTVFEIAAGSSSITTLAAFAGSNGANPVAGLTLDAAGDLFGTTTEGGAADDGTAFELLRGATSITVLATFTGSNGADPVTGLTANAAGDLFGTTVTDSINGAGTLFELAPPSTSTTSEAPVTPFAGVAIGDPNSGATETLTITLSGAGGTLSGAGLSGGGGTYTLSGTASAVTSALETLSFTPAAGQPNTSNTTTFALSDQSTAFATPVNSGGITVTDIDPAVTPTIAGGTVVTSTTLEAPVTPFAGVTLGDPNSGATDTLTITVSGGGTLSGAGLSGGGTLYTLNGTASAITSALDALSFTPVSGLPNTSRTTSFTLSDQSTAFATPTTASGFAVTDTDPAVAPTLSGAPTSTATMYEAPVSPFAAVSVGDPNSGATDTLTITVNGGGTLDGFGLSGSGTTYTLSGTADNVTDALENLTFTPVSGQPNTSSTTTFTLSDQSTAFATPTTASGFAVTDSDPAIVIAGGAASTTTHAEAPVTPFAGVTVSDPSSGATDTLFIDTGGDGILAGAGLAYNGQGIYVLSGTAAAVTSALDALTFTPSSGQPNGSATNTFKITAQSTAFSAETIVGGFSVTNIDPPAAPAIFGAEALTTLGSFTGPNGADPFAGVSVDRAGDLFGTAQVGGAGDGTVFELTAGASTLTTLASFTGGNGADPVGGVTEDGAGDLFGTTDAGGTAGEGTVFELAAGASSITVLASFNGANGAYPGGALIADAAGDLFGTTEGDGITNSGTVFELAAGSSTITTLATFTGSNGAVPGYDLVADAAGDLFGVTISGGSAGDGTVFELAAGASTVTTLASFTGPNPPYPNSPLVLDATGDLFGTTQDGGSAGEGTIFELSSGGSTLTTLATLTGSDVVQPAGGLIADAAGDLFGLADEGGSAGDGSVFELPSGGSTVGTLAVFTGPNGASPQDTLTADAAGNLFGTTYAGGSAGQGTVFELSPAATSTTSEAPVTPFQSVTVDDPNAGGTDVLTITIDGAGGALSGAGLSSAGGFYTLSGTAAEITGAVDALVFTPAFGQPNTSSVTTFTLSDASSVFATPATTRGFTVTDIDPGVAPTLSGGPAATPTTSEAPVSPFTGVTLRDPNGGATDTLRIVVNGGGTLAGTGLSGSGTTYTLSGTAATITSALDALSFTPTAGQPNTSSTTTFTLIDRSTGFSGLSTASGFAVTDTDPAVAPTLTGGTAATATTHEALVTPFAGVTLSDPNSGGTDTLTITNSGGGTLSGAGLSGGGTLYTLSGTATDVTAALDALSFTPDAGEPDTRNTTTFTLTDQSTAFPTPTQFSPITVTDFDPGPPGITGGSAHATIAEAPVTPFAGVAISDLNSGAVTDTLTITVSGGGTLSGTGLSGGGGTYTLDGTAAAVTSALDALVFTPTPGQPGSSTKTIFTLTDQSTGFATATTSSGFAVTDIDGFHTTVGALTPYDTLSGGQITVSAAGSTGTDILFGGGSSLSVGATAMLSVDSAPPVPVTYEGYAVVSGVDDPVVLANGAYDVLGYSGGAATLPIVEESYAYPACYVRGTMIRTASGDRPVESLAEGDVVVTASGEERPVKWIGRRSYARRVVAANPGLQPIRFRAGSLGQGLPCRDLLVSPEHAMLLDGALIPARCLVNGVTIAPERMSEPVEYLHVELETHDVLLAEGAAAESFLDDGSRGKFQNAAEYAARHPAPPSPGAFCAPRVEAGAALEAVRRRLATRLPGARHVA